LVTVKFIWPAGTDDVGAEMAKSRSVIATLAVDAATPAGAPDAGAPDAAAADAGGPDKAGPDKAGPDEAGPDEAGSDLPPLAGSLVATGAATTLTKRLLPLTALALKPTARMAPIRAMPEMRTVMR
jgi:hypothetical protein